MTPDASTSWAWPDDYDFFESTRLLRTGGNDPTVRREHDGLWRTARLPSGPATVRIVVDLYNSIEATAWGDGADEALAQVPQWIGLADGEWDLPDHPVTDRLLKAHRGLRLINTIDVFESLIPTILQQRVTWQEAAFAWRGIVNELGDDAPGPAGLMLVPTPRAIRAAGIEKLVRLGVGRQQARTIYEVAFSASRLQRASELPTSEAMALLEKVRGVGPWTSASVMGMRLGRPEPVIVGDLHLPNSVCWALAGEARGDDERMQELLAPFDGHAFRVVRLLFAARIEAPRRGPRREIRFGRN